mgnify:FL=1
MNGLMAGYLALGFGLSLAERVGCNRLVIHSDNLKVTKTKKNGGKSAGAAATFFDDCYHLACDFSFSRFEHCTR